MLRPIGVPKRLRYGHCGEEARSEGAPCPVSAIAIIEQECLPSRRQQAGSVDWESGIANQTNDGANRNSSTVLAASFRKIPTFCYGF
jgi:hypothetical protein